MRRLPVQVLFDEEWYRRRGPVPTRDAYLHFASIGWREKRDPHPLFDVAYYLEQAPEVAAGDENPLEHYLRVGGSLGLDPHRLFDSAFYVDQYGDAVADANPLVHYLETGGRNDFDPSPFFVSSLYRAAWSDIGESGFAPLVHYARHGGSDWRRAPHPMFDAQSYARRHELALGVNPLADFVRRLKGLRAHRPGSSARPSVSAVVLNRDSSLLTLNCVVDLMDSANGDALEVVVVDNGSDPSDFAFLTKFLPFGVTLLRLGEARSFGEAVNIGVDASHGANLLLLNGDVFVARDTLDGLTRELHARPEAGAVGPAFIYPDGRPRRRGGMLNADGTAVLHDTTATEAVDYLSAACMLLPRALFDAAGGFDLVWDPTGYEDADLCLKLRLLGRRVYCAQSIVVTQVDHGSSPDAAHESQLGADLEVNRQKFVARWGEYLARGEASAAPRDFPSPLDVEPPPFARTAVLYTPYQLVPGGGERYLLSIAQLLSRTYRTTLLTPEKYSSHRLRRIAHELGLDLSRVQLENVANVSRVSGCDVFFAMGNQPLPPIAAIGRRNIFICQFPFSIHPNHVASLWGALDGYDDVVVYSEFSARHFRDRAKRFSQRIPRVTVLPPASPIYEGGDPSARVPGRIANVGRFSRGGHCKRQDTLIDAFRTLSVESGRADLELHLVGTVAADAASRDYYLDLRRRAGDLPVTFHPNAAPGRLRRIYESSSYYWHATGFGTSETLLPERMEHFGISVVEAMSAGAIPLVYAAAGPAELVQDGVTGAHWRTVAELVRLQLELFNAPAASLDLIRARGIASARRYDLGAFEKSLAALLDGGATAWVPPRSGNVLVAEPQAHR